MSLARCPKGHYYDDSRFTSCPNCGIGLEGLFDELHAIGDEEKTICRIGVSDDVVTVSKSSQDDEIRTIAKFSMDNNTAPVVGWLICAEGGDRGSDYRLYTGVNHAGRGDKADIRFYNDEQISRGTHFLIIYDPQKNQFHIMPGEGTITRLNGEVITKPEGLKPYDRIEAGMSAFDFIPYCTGGYHW